jgi:hypothetical protein
MSRMSKSISNIQYPHIISCFGFFAFLRNTTTAEIVHKMHYHHIVMTPRRICTTPVILKQFSESVIDILQYWTQLQAFCFPSFLPPPSFVYYRGRFCSSIHHLDWIWQSTSTWKNLVQGLPPTRTTITAGMTMHEHEPHNLSSIITHQHLENHSHRRSYSCTEFMITTARNRRAETWKQAGKGVLARFFDRLIP